MPHCILLITKQFINNFSFRKIISAFILLLHCPFLFSREMKFTRIGAEQGLSQSVVNCVIRDKKGFMWFGTDDGLNRYDGYEMVVLKNIPGNKNSLSNNGILCLFEDENGILWIGTNGGGLNEFDPLTNSFRRHLHDANDGNSLSSNIVRTIFKDSGKNLWIGTEEGLNLLTDTGTFIRFTKANGLKNERIWSLCEDPDKTLWIGTYGGGLHSFDRKTQTFRQYPDKKLSDKTQFQSSQKIRCLFIDPKGALWVGTHGVSLCTFQKDKQEFTHYDLISGEPAEVISKIIEYDNDHLVIGTRNGLVKLEISTGVSELSVNEENNFQSIGHNSISDIFMDTEGSVWIGSNGGGVSVYHQTSNKFRHFRRNKNSPEALSSSKIYAFTEDAGNNLWIGTYGGGLSMYDKEKKAFINYPKQANKAHDNILCLLTDADNLLWFGTWGGGMNYYDPKKKSFGIPLTNIPDKNSLCNNSVLCLREDKNGLLWIGTFKGLDTYDKKKKFFRKYTVEDGLGNNTIQTLLFDRNGNLWIGTAGGGLNVMDVKTGSIKVYAENNGNKGISSNIVNSIHEDKNGNIWIGTVMGLCKMNVKDETFEHFFEKDGLPNDYVYGILEDNAGYLWLSTNKGLAKFNPSAEAHDPNRIKTYSALEGLQGYEFNQGAFYRSKKGEMFFGGENGFNAFSPEQIADNKHIPPVLITSFKIYGKEMKLDTGISQKKFLELSYRDNFFSFEFVALDFVLSAKNLYSWKMEGLDEDWSPPSPRRYANYTGLGGGDYIFHVRAANNDGVWNEEGAAIHIRINPPFWKTKWFYALCTLSGIFSLFAFIRIRTEQIRKEKRILEEKVAERTRELAEKNKDITDSIHYAKRIQEAILPAQDHIFRHLPESFIFYKPKDIVSGDFYWFFQRQDIKIIAAVDCTGHGVPGAFMSMIGHNLLNQIVIEKGETNPASILTLLNKGVQDALKQRDGENTSMDGMDIALCVINRMKNEFEFAGAVRPLYFFRKGNLEKLEGSKFPIGGVYEKEVREFECFKRAASPGDILYMFSDGYADQFGGPKGKKFMIKRLQELLTGIHHKAAKEQQEILEKNLVEWRGNLQQVDDILIVGIRF